MWFALAALVLTGADRKGIQDGWAFDDQLKPILTREVAHTMKNLGAKWVRLHFRLNSTHPTWDEALLKAYDRSVAVLEAENLNVLGLVTYESHPGTQKDWIKNNVEVDGGNGDNSYLRTWAQHTFRLLLKRYPRITHWEVWNEPNCWTMNAPGDKTKLPGQYYLYPSNFAWLLKYAAAEAKAVKPARSIVSGGLLGADFTGEPIGDTGIPYLRDTFRMGREQAGWGSIPPADVWGIHFYIRSGGLTDPTYFEPFLTTFETEMNKLDPRRTPIWITEIGWQTDPGGLSEEGQAKNLSMMFADLEKRTQYGPVFYFKLKDEPAANLRFGLLRDDGSLKPAYEVFRNARG